MIVQQDDIPPVYEMRVRGKAKLTYCKVAQYTCCRSCIKLTVEEKFEERFEESKQTDLCGQPCSATDDQRPSAISEVGQPEHKGSKGVLP
jgi:hypothetical protein